MGLVIICDEYKINGEGILDIISYYSRKHPKNNLCKIKKKYSKLRGFYLL